MAGAISRTAFRSLLRRIAPPRSARPFSAAVAIQYESEWEQEEEEVLDRKSTARLATNAWGEMEGRGVQWVFMGSPGAKKHLYANRLAELLEVPYISMGTLVRQELDPTSSLYIKIANAVNEGKLVPEDIIFGLLSKRLEEGYLRGETGFILDGIPRTRVQAEILDQIADIDLVVNFKCLEDSLVKKDFGSNICSHCRKSFDATNSESTSLNPCLATRTRHSQLKSSAAINEGIHLEKFPAYTEQGLMSDSERDRILSGLDEIEKRIEAGEFVWRTDREDVHMNIEAALTDLIGEPAKKLHTARSRNDQVVTDLRLWCRDAIDKIITRIKQLQVALVKLALKNEGLIVPGYTHLQRAQPVLLQHLLLSYVEQLERDASRLVDCKHRMNFCPLGACALAGTGLPINRFMTSDALGFSAPMRNSIDAVSDRDFVLEFLSANSITAIHLSRLGEEWVLWASEEFGFLTPSDAVSTGSSIMPQKKNPDPMELVRGKSARVVGSLTTLLVLCKGLPLAYNRDLQEDKEPLFDSVRTVIGMLEVTTEFAQNITFNFGRIQKALPAGHLDATTVADYLVNKGVPFRTSHDIVGRAVALCVSRNCQLSDLTLDDLRGIDPVFEEDVYEFLGVENCVKKFRSYGSTGSECVHEQINHWVLKLGI